MFWVCFFFFEFLKLMGGKVSLRMKNILQEVVQEKFKDAVFLMILETGYQPWTAYSRLLHVKKKNISILLIVTVILGFVTSSSLCIS